MERNRFALMALIAGLLINPGCFWQPQDLLEAAARNDVSAAARFLERGADIHIRDEFGGTPLHYAAHFGYMDMIEFLVNGGADVNAQDGDGDTPLHEAVRAGHVDAVRLLLQNGADVTIRGMGGDTPLEDAVFWGHEEIIGLLRQASGNQITS